MIGELESELQAKGLAQNTYFVFSSDNGFHMGEYRSAREADRLRDRHPRPADRHRPWRPGRAAASQLASNIDLAPTFETLAGLPVPAEVDGHSLAGPVARPGPGRLAARHPHRASRPGFLARRPRPADLEAGGSAVYEAVRTPTALYVRYAGGVQEYYDTATDPDELDNLAGKGVPAVLRNALSALENCHGGAACWAAAQLG